MWQRQWEDFRKKMVERPIVGELGRRWADLRGRPIAHMLHISKTGGTAIMYAVRRGRSRMYRVEFHEHSVSLHDIPSGEDVFFFLRDPLTRFTSGFYSRQRQGRPRYNEPWSPGEVVAFKRFHTASELAEALSEQHPDHAAAVEAMANIDHVNVSFSYWFGNNDYLNSRVSDLLFIGFQEQLDADFASLSQLLQLRPGVRLPTDTVLAHRNPPVDRSLSDAAVANLRLWYAADYELLDLGRKLRKALDARNNSIRPTTT